MEITSDRIFLKAIIFIFTFSCIFIYILYKRFIFTRLMTLGMILSLVPRNQSIRPPSPYIMLIWNKSIGYYSAKKNTNRQMSALLKLFKKYPRSPTQKKQRRIKPQKSQHCFGVQSINRIQDSPHQCQPRIQ